MEKILIGIDVGGTAIKSGALTKEGKVLAKVEIPTEKEGGERKVLQNIAKCVDMLLQKANLSKESVLGVGIGIPGIVNTKTSEVIFCNNLGWEKVDVMTDIKEFLPYPVLVGNDANVAALGEARFGIGKGFSDTCLITLGTGVGSGFVFNGKLYGGNLGAGAEMGHIILVKNGEPCSCGQKGCFEAYCSATALSKFAKRKAEENKSSKLYERLLANGDITAKDVFDLSESDLSAKTVLNEYIEKLADGLLILVNGFRPEAIMLGGGVSKAGEKLTVPLQKMLDENTFAKKWTPKVKVLVASLGNDAGFMGAAALFLD